MLTPQLQESLGRVLCRGSEETGPAHQEDGVLLAAEVPLPPLQPGLLLREGVEEDEFGWEDSLGVSLQE